MAANISRLRGVLALLRCVRADAAGVFEPRFTGEDGLPFDDGLLFDDDLLFFVCAMFSSRTSLSLTSCPSLTSACSVAPFL